MTRDHGHEHPDVHGHEHGIEGFKRLERRRLILSLLITVVVMVIEIVGGFLSGSIALISDAGHMFTHVFALGIALAAIHAAAQPVCHHRTFGLARAEILAAFVNSLFLGAVGLYIIYESILRFIHPENVLSLSMLMVAVLGLVANVASVLILRESDRADMNIRGVILHMLADAVSSLAIVAGAVVIYYTHWVAVDPLISIGISLLIVVWGWNLFRESARILLQEAPVGADSETVAKDILENFPEVAEVEMGRLWCLTPDRCVYTAHVTLREGVEPENSLLDRIARHLKARYDIIETTLQVRR